MKKSIRILRSLGVRLPVRIFGGVWKPPTTILQSRMLSLKHRRLTIPMQRSPKPSSMKRCWRLQEEDFGFTHYGLISDAILDLMEQGSEQVAADLLEQFRLLFKTAKRFHIDSLEAMMYQVNDGLDMIGVVTFLLDILMEQGRRDKEQYRVLIAFVDKFLHVFSKTSDFFRVGMQYEQAKAYIALKSKKENRCFKSC